MPRYDRNITKGLDLIAEQDYRHQQYAPIDSNIELQQVPLTILKQLHTVANAYVCGLTGGQKPGFDPSEWSVFGSKRSQAMLVKIK